MNLIRIMATISFLIMGISCKNNPYPTDAIFEPIVKKVEKSQQPPLLFLHAPAVMRFVEGEEGVYEVKGITPSGKALIEASNLPGDATFDSDTNELRWTPGSHDGSSSLYDNTNYSEYTVSFQLYDAEDSLYFMEKKVSLIVFDKPQDVAIETDKSSVLYEEKEHSQNVTFRYQDGTDAVVTNFYSKNLPAGASIREVKKGKKYRLVFKPEIFEVTPYSRKDNEGNYYKDINFEVQAIGFNGNVFTEVVNWRIYDKKKPIEIFAPRAIKTNGDVFFTVILVDRNGETSPTLDVRQNRRGRRSPFTIKKTIFSKYGDKGEKWSYYSVYWENVPRNKLGTIYELKLESCAHRSRRCRTFSVNIDFIAPVIDGVTTEEGGATL